MPNNPKTHEECRRTVCFLCMKKCDRQVTEFMKERIKALFKQEIDFNDPKVPSGICNSCRTNLQKRDSGQINAELPQLYDFQAIKIVRRTTDCSCLICQIGRSKFNHTHPSVSSVPSSSQQSSSQTQDRLCSLCLTVIRKGFPHQCTKAAKFDNLKKIVQTDSRAGEKLAASVIEQKVASPKGTKRLIREQGGKPLSLTPGPSCQALEKSPLLSTTDLVKVQVNTGLSNNKIRGLATTLNKSFGARLIEPNFRGGFANIGKQLESFFTVTTVHDTSKKESPAITVVHCNNLSEFAAMVSDRRGISKPSSITKIGIDGGGNFLKFSLSIIDTQRFRTQSSSQRTTVLTASTSLDTGVKQQLIVAIAENMPENYENIKSIFALLGIGNTPFFIACDMKVANILCGIQSHSSCHPCCWCDITSDNLQGKTKNH